MQPPTTDVLDRLRCGEPVLSLGVRYSRNADVVRMAAALGYGVVWIDLEHSAMSIECASQMAATAMDLGIEGWVRVPEREHGAIGRLLDCGASGIIIPKVETAAQAAEAAAACRFPPEGARSCLARLPQSGFVTTSAAQLMRDANNRVVLRVLIESALGVANVDAIAGTVGVDIIAIGSNDLTADLGCPGEMSDPRVIDAIAAVASACAHHGKIAAIGGVGDAARFAELLRMGFAPLIFAGIDTDIMATGLAQRARDWTARLSDIPNTQG